VVDISGLLKANISFNTSLPGRRGNLVEREVKGPLAIIGDLHGERNSLESIVDMVHHLAEGAEYRVTWFFLGDYVDRGPDSVGVLEEILSFALENESDTVLLRGNHEDRRMNMFYGFATELAMKNMDNIVPLLEEWYESLPLIAVADPIVMLHGGPPFPLPSSADSFSGIKFPEPQAMHILWSDPYDEFYENRGGGTRSFSKKECEHFLRLMHCSVLIRGHQYVPGRGYKINFGSCLTLFSASYGKGWPRCFVYMDDTGQVSELEKHVYAI